MITPNEATLPAGQQCRYSLTEGRKAYLVACGDGTRVNGVLAGDRDGVAVSGEPELLIEALEDSEVVLVDMT